MKYEVFPFGKYKGVKLKDLPSTYIILALESFALPEELNTELGRIIYGRLGVYTSIKESIFDHVRAVDKVHDGLDLFIEYMTKQSDRYEK